MGYLEGFGVTIRQHRLFGGKRVTTMQGVALAMGLGIGYSILVTVFGKLGIIC